MSSKITKASESAVLELPMSKTWSITATTIGVLVVIGVGGTGCVGLLQSFGIISLPQGIGSAAF